MADFSSIKQAVATLRAQVEQASITPEMLGSILNDLLVRTAAKVQPRQVDNDLYLDLIDSGNTVLGSFKLPSCSGTTAGIVPPGLYTFLQEGAVDGKHAMAQKGQPSGFATLGSDGKLTSAQLPAITSAMLPPEMRVHVGAFDGFKELTPEQGFEQMGLSPMAGAKVYFSKAKGAFYCVKDEASLTSRKVYLTWAGNSLMDASVAMGTEDSTRGVVPVTGKLYYCRADKAYYLWNGSYMQPELAAQEEYKERALIAEAETAGATWNAETRHFSLNGLTDISIDEMRKILVYGNRSLGWGAFAVGNDTNRRIRTNIAPSGIYSTQTDAQYLCTGQRELEVFVLRKNEPADGVFCTEFKSSYMAFQSCSSLRRIVGKIKISRIIDYNGVFDGCLKLEDIQLAGLSGDTYLGNLPALSLESLRYMMQNSAAPDAGITLTVHSDVYAKITDTTNTDWFALLDLAAQKNVNIATTA